MIPAAPTPGGPPHQQPLMLVFPEDCGPMTAESTPRRSPRTARAETNGKTSGPSRARSKGSGNSVSRLLVEFGEQWKDERIGLGSLLVALEHRGYGMLLILFA